MSHFSHGYPSCVTFNIPLYLGVTTEFVKPDEIHIIGVSTSENDWRISFQEFRKLVLLLWLGTFVVCFNIIIKASIFCT